MKRIMAFLIIATMFLSVGTVNAAVLNDAEVNFSNNTVTISGNAGEQYAHRFVSLQVVNPGKSFANLFTEDGVLNRSEQAFIKDDGSFEFEFIMDGESGDYSYFVGVDGMSDTMECKTPFTYYTTQYISGIWSNLKAAIDSGNDTVLKDDIEKYSSVLQIDTTEYDNLPDDAARERVRKGIIRYGVEEINDFSAVFNDAVNTYKLYAETDYEVFKTAVSSVFEGANAKIKESYDAMTDKSAVLQSVRDGDFYNTKDILDIFTEKVRLITLNSKKLWTEIDRFVNIEGCFDSDDISAYTSCDGKQSVATDLLENIPYISIDKFISDLKTLSENYDGGNGGGYGSSKGSSSSTGGGKTYADVNYSNVVPTTNSAFSDLSGFEWAAEYINKLSKSGIVSGNGGNFYPAANVTRAEFLKMGLLAAEINMISNSSSKFNDVNNDDWYALYVLTAADLKVVSGVGNGEFNPNGNISRQDIAVILYNILKHKGMISEKELSVPADIADISDYAKEAVSYLTSSGIINGFEDGTFRGKNMATRAEAAALISRFADMIN